MFFVVEIVKTHDGDTVVFTLSGRLDTATAPTLQEVLIPEFDLVKHIILDFAELNYISSAGLRVFLISEKIAKMSGATQTFRNVSPEIREIFDMTGFSSLLHIE